MKPVAYSIAEFVNTQNILTDSTTRYYGFKERAGKVGSGEPSGTRIIGCMSVKPGATGSLIYGTFHADGSITDTADEVSKTQAELQDEMLALLERGVFFLISLTEYTDIAGQVFPA